MYTKLNLNFYEFYSFTEITVNVNDGALKENNQIASYLASAEMSGF